MNVVGTRVSHPRAKWVAAGVVLLALLIVPAPLLPPHRFAEFVQSVTGVGWKAAYFLAALGLQIGFYGAVGMLATFFVERGATARKRLLQIAILPVVVVGVAFVIRCVKAGHLPIWVNAVIPISACLVGAALGLGLFYRRWKLTLGVAVAVIALAAWGLLGSASAPLRQATTDCLHRLVEAGPVLPAGDARFGALLQTAFASPPGGADPMLQNRAAILALGIAVGHERLARSVGLERDDALVRQAVALRSGTTLRTREDWSRHYCLSAALAILEHPLISDAGGLMKEQLDALTHGSGFSFGDLAADRAGIRFATTATDSAAAAVELQKRLQAGYRVADFFPPVADLPENLTVEQFRHDFGGVGSPRYRQMEAEIETRLAQCAALAHAPARQE